MERMDVEALTERARDFHGHMCPGLAIGIQAARIATMVKDSVGAFAHQFRRPHLVLRDTNRLLLEKKVTG